MKASKDWPLVLVPITTNIKEMEPYLVDDFCLEVFMVYQEFYPKIGFHLPWVGYFVLLENEVVGVGGYKGPPQHQKIEIAYGTVPGKEGQGYGSKICQLLTAMALKEDPTIQVTARTLMEESASTSILKKNGFQFAGVVVDPEDGEVWEWVYR